MNQANRIIRKYPNRRLYDTATSTYITLNDVRRLVVEGVGLTIEDARTREDLTRSVLLQIIMDGELGRPLFSLDALTRLIRCHGKPVHGAIGACLERNLQIFADFVSDGQAAAATEEEVAVDSDDGVACDESTLQQLVSRCMEHTAMMYGEMQACLQRE